MTSISSFSSPLPTVDVVIEMACGGIVLVERANPPYGWALPGGFVDVGESCERAAVREVLEETGLRVALLRQLGTYSEPNRDPRQHTLSVVFAGRPLDAQAVPRGGDDAKSAQTFGRDEIPWGELAFDHARILHDYFDGTGPAVTLTGVVELPLLTESQGRELLRHARHALERFLRDGEIVGERLPDPRLRARQGVFVSLFDGDKLQSCMGRMHVDLALDEAVVEMALLCAAADSRFQPLTEGGLAQQHLVIDVVERTWSIPDPGAVLVGEHGIAVEHQGRRGVLLPRVAPQFGWNAERFVAAACEKGGMPDTTWMHPDARFQVFTTQTLRERA